MYRRCIPIFIFALLFGFVFDVQAQTSCFTSGSWEGPGADPPSGNRAKPIYSACGSAQIVQSDINFQGNILVDGSGADTELSALFITHDGRDDYPALQATLSAGTLVAQFGSSNNYTNGVPSGYAIRIQDTSNNPEIQLKYGSGSGDHWAIYSSQSGSDSFRIWNGSDRLTITNAGKIGIGTTSPRGQLGIEQYMNTNTSFSALSLGDFSSSNYGLIEYFKASSSNSSYMSLLGHSSSNDYLTLLGSGVMSLGNLPSSSTSDRRAVFEYSQGSSDNNSYLTIRGSADPASQNQLVLMGDGDIGIGTNNPDERLHIDNGNVHIEDGDFYIENGGLRYKDGSEGTDKVLVSDSSGNATWEDVDNVVTQDVNWIQSSSDLYVKNTGWTVGIGTPDPSNSYKLDVNGNTRITGDLLLTDMLAVQGDVLVDDHLESINNSIFDILGRDDIRIQLDSNDNDSNSTFSLLDGDDDAFFTANEAYQFYFGNDANGARVVVDLDNDLDKGFYVTRYGETDEGFRAFATDNDLYFEYNEDTGESKPGTWHFINQESNGTGGSIQNRSEFMTAKWKGSPDNKTFVGILNTDPQHELDVGGDVQAIGFYTVSDVRFKKNITPLDSVLKRVSQLQPVTYQWNAKAKERGVDSEAVQYGFIAQEVESIFPEMVTTDSNGYKAVSYDRVGVLLVKALQEQQVQIQELEQRLEYIEQRLENLETHD